MRWSEADLELFRQRRGSAQRQSQAQAAVSPSVPQPTPSTPRARRPRQVDLPLGDGERKRRRNDSPTEFAVHRGVVEHLTKLGRPDLCWWHTPNGEHRDVRVAQKLKGLGTKPGLPDILLLIEGRLYGLELKRERGGSLSAAQKDMHLKLIRAGATVATARGLDEALTVLRGWGAFGPVTTDKEQGHG